MNNKITKVNAQSIRCSELNLELKELKERRIKKSSIKEMIIEITGQGEGNRGIPKNIQLNQPDQVGKIIVIPHPSSHQVPKDEERKRQSPVYQKPKQSDTGYYQHPLVHSQEKGSEKYDSQTYTHNSKRNTSKNSKSKSKNALPLAKAYQRPLTPLTPHHKDQSPYIKQIINNGVGLHFDETNSTQPIDLVSHSHFSNHRPLTTQSPTTVHNQKEDLFPLKKNSIMYEIYKKYSKRLSDYILNNQNSIRLYGNEKYTNKDPAYYLKNKRDIDDITKNSKETTRVIKGSYVTKSAGNEIIHKYQMYIKERGGRVDLTPLPSKSRKKMKNQVEKEEFYEVERSVVSMRRFEYNKRIKTRYLYSQEISNSDNLPKIVYMQRWWRECLYRRYIVYQITKMQSVLRGYLLRKTFNQEIQNNMADIVFTSLESFFTRKLKTIFVWKLKQFLAKKLILLPTEHKATYNLTQKIIKSTRVPMREIALIQSVIRMNLMKKYIVGLKQGAKGVRKVNQGEKQKSSFISKKVFRKHLSYIVYIQRMWRYCAKRANEKDSKRRIILKKPIVSAANSIINTKSIVVLKKKLLTRPVLEACLLTKEEKKEKILTRVRSTESLFQKKIKRNNEMDLLKISQIQYNWRAYLTQRQRQRQKDLIVHTHKKQLERCVMVKRMKRSSNNTGFILKIKYIQIYWRKISEAKLKKKKNDDVRIVNKAKANPCFSFISKDHKATNHHYILNSIKTIQLYWKYHLKKKQTKHKPINYLRNYASPVYTKTIINTQISSFKHIVYIQRWWKQARALRKAKEDRTQFYSKPKITNANGFCSRIYKKRSIKPCDELPTLFLPKTIPYICTKTMYNKTYIDKCLKRIKETLCQFLLRKASIPVARINKKNSSSYCSKTITQPKKQIHQKVVLAPEIRNKETKVNKNDAIKTIQVAWKSSNNRKKRYHTEITRVNRFHSQENSYISKERLYEKRREEIIERPSFQAICFLSKEYKENKAPEIKAQQRPIAQSISYLSKCVKEKQNEIVQKDAIQSSSYCSKSNKIQKEEEQTIIKPILQSNCYLTKESQIKEKTVIQKPFFPSLCYLSKKNKEKVFEIEILMRPQIQLTESSMISKETMTNKTKSTSQIRLIQSNYRHYLNSDNEEIMIKPMHYDNCLVTKEQNDPISITKPHLTLCQIKKTRGNLPLLLCKIKLIQNIFRRLMKRDRDDIRPITIPKYSNYSLNTKIRNKDAVQAVYTIVTAIRNHIKKKNKIIQRKTINTNVISKICRSNYDSYNSNKIIEKLSSIELIHPIKKPIIAAVKGYSNKERKEYSLWAIIKLQKRCKQYVKDKKATKRSLLTICETRKRKLINNNSAIELISRETLKYLKKKQGKFNQYQPIQIVLKEAKGNSLTKIRKKEIQIKDISVIQTQIRKFIVKKEIPLRLLLNKQTCQSSKKRKVLNLSAIILIQHSVKSFLLRHSQQIKPLEYANTKVCYIDKKRYEDDSVFISHIQHKYRIYNTGRQNNSCFTKPLMNKCYISKEASFNINDEDISKVIHIEKSTKNYLRTKNKQINMEIPIDNPQCFVIKTRRNSQLHSLLFLQKNIKGFLAHQSNKTKETPRKIQSDICYFTKTQKGNLNHKINYIQSNYRAKGRNKKALDVIPKPIWQLQTEITKQSSEYHSLELIVIMQRKVKQWFELKRSTKRLPKAFKCLLSKENHVNSLERIIFLQKIARKWLRDSHKANEENNLIKKPMLKSKGKAVSKNRAEINIKSIFLIQRFFRLLLRKSMNTPQKHICIIEKQSLNNQMSQVKAIQSYFRKVFHSKAIIKPGKPILVRVGNQCCSYLSKISQSNSQVIKLTQLQRNIKSFLIKNNLHEQPKAPHSIICYFTKAYIDNDSMKALGKLQIAIRSFLFLRKKPIGKPVISLYFYNSKESVELVQSKPDIGISYLSKNHIEPAVTKPIIPLEYISKADLASLPLSLIKEDDAMINKPIAQLTYISKAYRDYSIIRPSIPINYISKTLINPSVLIKPIISNHYVTKRYVVPPIIIRPIVNKEYITKDTFQITQLRPLLQIAFLSKDTFTSKKPFPPQIIQLLFSKISQSNNQYTIDELISINDKDIAKIDLQALFYKKENYEMRNGIKLAQERKKLFYFLHLLKQRIIKNNQEFSFEKMKTATDFHDSFDSQLSNITNTKATGSFYFLTLRRHLILNTNKENNTPEANVVLKKVKDHLKETVPLFFVKYYNKKIIPKITPEQRIKLEETNLYAPNEINEMSSYINFCFEKENKIQNSKKDLISSRLERDKLTNTNIFGITRYMDRLFKNALKLTYCPQCYCKEKETCQQKCYCHREEEEEPDIIVNERIVKVAEIPMNKQEVYSFAYAKEDNRQHVIKVNLSKIEKEEHSEDDFDPLDATTTTKNKKNDLERILLTVKNSARRMRTEEGIEESKEEEQSEDCYLASTNTPNKRSNLHAKTGINYRNLLSENAKKKAKQDSILIRDSIRNGTDY